jgi:hypothetical protein
MMLVRAKEMRTQELQRPRLQAQGQQQRNDREMKQLGEQLIQNRNK